MNFKKIISLSAGTALLAGFVIITPAFAAESNSPIRPNNAQGERGQGRMMGQKVDTNRGLGIMQPGVSGLVTSVNGNTITINGHLGMASTTVGTIYTIDASNAIVKKNNATSTVSAIVIGDRINAQGTITGTNVIATSIYDGIMGRGQENQNGERNENGAKGPRGMSSTTPILGNGQPVVAGTVSAISGSTLTVTTTSNVTYTVDASNAKIMQGPNTITLSNIVVGTKIVAQGTINGNSVIASTILDQAKPANDTQNQSQGAKRGFFGSIGSFFSHLFGF